MTRINVVPVEELCDKHLFAEDRELPRVFNLARLCPDAPKEYTLGKGHVKFFYDKLRFLTNRNKQLIDECLKRGFGITYTTPRTIAHRIMEPELYNDYIPTPEALALNRARIAERISQFRRPL